MGEISGGGIMKFALRSSILLVLVVELCAVGFAGEFGSVTKYKIADGVSGYSVVLGDFNNDGVLDIAVSAGGYVWTLLGNGEGTFQTAKQYCCASTFGTVRGLAT